MFGIFPSRIWDPVFFFRPQVKNLNICAVSYKKAEDGEVSKMRYL